MPIYFSREEKRRFAEDRGILVDPEDVWLLEEYTWHVNNTGYACTNIVFSFGGEGVRIRKTTLLHHCIVGQPVWGWEEIDHINQDRIDNRRSNLRYVTKSQQNINTSREFAASGYRNIYERGGMFFVVIRRNGKMHHLGSYENLDEAVAERDEWLHKYLRRYV